MKIRSLFQLMTAGIILIPIFIFIGIWVYFRFILDFALPPPRPIFSPFNPAIVTFSVIAVLSVFVIVMSILIARSITRSVMVLEDATRRIERGERNISINARGSNEITSLTASLNRMQKSLKAEEDRRNLFIMGVTHDLKTPLALIKANAEAIEDNIARSPDEQRRSLEIISNKVDDMETQINNMLDYVRMDSVNWEHKKEKINFASFLSDYAEHAAVDAELLHRHITQDIKLPDAAPVFMDAELVRRALDNLVNNSLRYCHPGGTITIAAVLERGRSDGKHITLTVSDDGPGIDPDDMPHIFEIFYRGTNSRREMGQGIGLAIVKSIVDAHGWHIEAAPGPQQGVCFTISISNHSD
jgi:signal transduction histidine kinase